MTILVNGGRFYNLFGADDDGSGTVGVIENSGSVYQNKKKREAKAPRKCIYDRKRRGKKKDYGFGILWQPSPLSIAKQQPI